MNWLEENPTSGKTFAKVDGIIGVSTEITYFHYDNLGSTKLMTDQDGKIVMEQDYLPFGGDLPKVGQVEVYNEIGMEYKYTGQNEVVSIGLYYYGARYYDPAIGRFITEDTYPGEMNNPQSQHLYVYVMNNPLRYIDPTGHMAKPVLLNGGGGGSWDEDDSAGGIDKPTGGNKPKDNNTDIEGLKVTKARTSPDAFIAAFFASFIAVNVIGVEPIITTASIAYATLDKGFEKAYYWMGGKTAKLRNVVSDRFSSLFNRGTGKASKWVDKAGNIKWPDNYGFKGTPKTKTLHPGKRIDRYGGSSGQFVSPEGTPFGMRSLPPGSETRPYNIYEVVKPIEVKAGEIAPWFNQPGGGTQYMFNKSIEELIKTGILRKVAP